MCCIQLDAICKGICWRSHCELCMCVCYVFVECLCVCLCCVACVCARCYVLVSCVCVREREGERGFMIKLYMQSFLIFPKQENKQWIVILVNMKQCILWPLPVTPAQVKKNWGAYKHPSTACVVIVMITFALVVCVCVCLCVCHVWGSIT